MKKRMFGYLSAALFSVGAFVCVQAAGASPVKAFTGLESYVQYVQQLHKAPFDRDGSVLPPGGAQALARKQAAIRAAGVSAPAVVSFKNVQVTQDRNPWPKAEVAAAVDPTSPQNWVVMSNDFRENFDKMFFHVSTDSGKTWTDDAMVGGAIPSPGSSRPRSRVIRGCLSIARQTATCPH